MAPQDALSQPTRARVCELLTDLRRPASTAELAERLGLHPNGVRTHLEQLLAAGLLERTLTRQPRGRPRHSWAISPDADPGGDPPSAYSDLSRWLSRAVPRRSGALSEVEAVGREIGRELAPRDAPEAGEAMIGALAALGFQPEVQDRGGGAVTYCLGNCPYRAAARQNPEVVCTLHRGITKGLLDALSPATRLEGFVARDPDQAGCLIDLSEQPEAGPKPAC